jgi:RNA polymerase sigma factor (sigma-70 family)
VPQQLSDNQLSRVLSEIQNGDFEQLAEIETLYRTPLRKYLSPRCGPEDDVDDFVQETLLQVCESILTYKLEPNRNQGARFWAWLKSIAHNTYIDSKYRRKGAKLRPISFESLGSSERSDFTLEDTLVANYPDPSVLAIDSESFRRFLKSLSDRERDVFVEYMDSDSDVDERVRGKIIATKLGLSVFAVSRAKSSWERKAKRLFNEPNRFWAQISQWLASRHER